jgi:hypothetical protein
MKKFFLIGMLIVPLMLFSQNKVKRSFKTESGKKLEIELTSGGSLEISGWDKNEVSVEVDLQGEVEKDFSMDFRERSWGIQIEITHEGRRRNRHNGVDVTVLVPRKYNLALETTGGDITIRGIEGNFSGETMGGEIDLYDLKGTVKLTTMGGEIHVENAELDGQVKTMGGEISLLDVIGDLDATTMGGEVSYKNVKKKDIRNDAKEVNISTMGGEIRVDDAPGGANVSTMGGEIEIRRARKYVKAKTMGGEINIREIDGGVKATTMGGDISVNMVGDPNEFERDVTLSSMGGDVKLTVPAELSMDFDIKLTITRKSEDAYKIISDFPIKIETSGERNFWEGSDHLYKYGTGKVKDGKNRIRIDTINGDIIIKKGK